MERQSILKEIGDSQNLQYLIDRTADRYRPILWPNWFTWKGVTSISYETLIGESSNAAAASVVSYDSAAPIRTRRHIKKLTGEVPSMREKFQMGEKEMQEYLRMVAGAGAGANDIIDLIFKDVQDAVEAPHKRLDMFVLEAISTSQITLNTTNNPDGLVFENNFDFGMPSSNKKTVGVVWSAAVNTTKPITDIMAVVTAGADAGIVFDRMLMRRATFNYLKLSDETVNYVTGYNIGTGTAKVSMTLARVNEFLLAEGLPKIVLIEASIGVEKDGVVTNSNPFDANNVSFLPAGGLGDMLSAPIVERAMPAKHVNYGDYNRVLIKKWSDTDPIREFTACELNAFPSWKNVDKCFLLDTETAT